MAEKTPFYVEDLIAILGDVSVTFTLGEAEYNVVDADALAERLAADVEARAYAAVAAEYATVADARGVTPELLRACFERERVFVRLLAAVAGVEELLSGYLRRLRPGVHARRAVEQLLDRAAPAPEGPDGQPARAG